MLAQDLGLAVDGILLGNAGVNALLGDVKKLLDVIAPAIRPVLIT